MRRKKKTFAQIVVEGNENKFNSVERNIEPEKNVSFTTEDMVVNPTVKSKDDINFADIYKNLLETKQNILLRHFYLHLKSVQIVLLLTMLQIVVVAEETPFLKKFLLTLRIVKF